MWVWWIQCLWWWCSLSGLYWSQGQPVIFGLPRPQWHEQWPQCWITVCKTRWWWWRQFLIYINVFPLRPILKGNPLFVDIQGLEYMNDDPGAVDVLYAKIQPSPEADKWALTMVPIGLQLWHNDDNPPFACTLVTFSPVHFSVKCAVLSAFREVVWGYPHLLLHYLPVLGCPVL